MNKNAQKILIRAIISLPVVLGIPAHAQQAPVLIQVRGRNASAGAPFSALLKNDLASPITFCTDFGQSVQTESARHAAPNPFVVQKWNGKRWDTQLRGTDVGSGDTPISVDAHESKEFVLEIDRPGRYRLSLTYQEGDNDTKCPLPQGKTATIRSNPFSVQMPGQR